MAACSSCSECYLAISNNMEGLPRHALEAAFTDSHLSTSPFQRQRRPAERGGSAATAMGKLSQKGGQICVRLDAVLDAGHGIEKPDQSSLKPDEWPPYCEKFPGHGRVILCLLQDTCPAFRKAQNLGDFANNPSSFYNPHLRHNQYACNAMWFDSGMEANSNFSVDLACSGEAMICKKLKLILLILQYFDQSMVVLKHTLLVAGFSAGEAEGVEGLDWYLYQAFNRSFWEEVRRFGQEARWDKLARICLRNWGKPVEAQPIRDKGIRPYQSGVVKILGYELRPGLDNITIEACLRLIRPEKQYKDLLDTKQFPRSQPDAGQDRR
ncbi:Galactose-3-O-sulfotransferase 2 [Merluccius polli]|uniref:Galactose-3-O-sulfotransferase 2 n=1 Tax=Merluccius polli TaxID=89951 RepID=A0AA47M294_MERPO|nr:Galactose-3-O-sulfotransferase 2 [Merluccius polli]